MSGWWGEQWLSSVGTVCGQWVERLDSPRADVEGVTLRIADAHRAGQQIKQPVVVWPAAKQLGADRREFHVDVLGQPLEFGVAEMPQRQ